MPPPTGLALVPAVAVPAQAVGKKEGPSMITGVQQGWTKRRGRDPSGAGQLERRHIPGESTSGMSLSPGQPCNPLQM